MVRRRGEAPPAPPDDVQPDEACFRLSFPHGFVDADGKHRFWHAGQVVRDADELELLRMRGADLKEG